MLETDRLLLRPWRVAEAAVQRELWLERDPRVPARRRIDADGRPTLADMEEWIRSADPSTIGLLAIERKAEGDVIGYAGLNTEGDAHELAYELLRRTWGHGYATEAAAAIVDHARLAGLARLTADVWAWNVASLGVLDKLGFVEVGRTIDPDRGANVHTVLDLSRA